MLVSPDDPAAAVVFDQRIDVQIAGSFGAAIVIAGVPRLVDHGHGGVAIDGDVAPLRVDQLNLGPPAGDQLLVRGDLLTVEVWRGGGRHHLFVAGSDGLSLRVVQAAYDLLDGLRGGRV